MRYGRDSFFFGEYARKRRSAQEDLCKELEKSWKSSWKKDVHLVEGCAQSLMGIVHVTSRRCIVRSLSLKTASSLGALVLVLTDLRKPRLPDLI